MKKKLCFLMSLCLVVTLLAACGGSGSTSTPTGGDEEDLGPVLIGCIYPFSGSNALLGDESFRGAKLAVDELNAAGGLWGRQIELVPADAPDITAGQTEAERLITRENMELIFGAYSSGLANVISDTCARYEVPYFEFGAIGADIMTKGYPYLWRTCADAGRFGKGQAEYFTNTVLPILGVSKENAKIAMAHEDTLYGTSVAEAAWKTLLDLGYKEENLKDIPYAATSVDLSSVILTAKSFNPDGLFSVSYVNDAILLARQAEELNFLPPFWIGAGGGTSMKPTLEAVGKGMYGLYGIDFPQYDINKDKIRGVDEFVQYYIDTFGDYPRSGHSMTNYAGMYILYDILTASGSLDKDAIKDAAAKIEKPMNTYTGGYGVKFDATGQNVNAPLAIGMWDLEKLNAVYPAEYQIMDPVIPMPTWEEKNAM